MTREDLIYLFKEFVQAVHFCNEAYADEFDEYFATDDLPGKFTFDIMPLAFYAAGADGKITEKELENVNNVLQHLGTHVDEEGAKGALKLVTEGHFEPPVTLVVFVEQASIRIALAKPEEREAVIEQECAFLNKVLDMYAEMMCSIAEYMTRSEKLVIGSCMESGKMYVESELGVSFELSDSILNRLK